MISRAVVLVFGTLYPAYSSYKAVRTKNVKEYVRWMMYWIVYALYTVVEALTDISLAWFPLYYELKVAFVIWLLSPYTRGASLIYRKFLHPLLASREREIDDYIIKAKERSYETMVNFGRQGLSIAATAAVSAAVKGQGAISERLRSFSIHDLSQIPVGDDETAPASQFAMISNLNRRANHSSRSGVDMTDSNPPRCDEGHGDDGDGLFSEDEACVQRGLKRSQSVKITRARAARKESRYGSLKMKPKRRAAINTATYDLP